MIFSPFLVIAALLSATLASPHISHQKLHDARSRIAPAEQNSRVCRLPEISPFDYSVKLRSDENAPICDTSKDLLLGRQTLTNDDYSCSETKPCSNGACCSKATGYCNYGPEACGTTGVSPNDMCWSNCDAHAECGQYAKTAGAACPLNVCCSQYGFCGMTDDFCSVEKTSTGGGCQSNCIQPGSGASGGDVQSRIIGYYEAWAHDRSCTGMGIKDIPVNALTHLHFAFGYITPDVFNLAPMDTLAVSLFSELTALKSRNSGLKCIVSLGGWTFSDNGAATQPVYSEIVSSRANRSKFIKNLLAFMREYAFDGVDFDWEYPGAPDRGGHPNDGINYTAFLKELRAAFDKEPVSYIISYTVPTSYWYLRWFDLTSVQYVDWINLMSYDLHGVWDSSDPIGSHVLAHTNLTEIRLALDLLWRNKVPAKKLNLGLGFYGRSFQLQDPSCHRPGCNFKGGAAPGPCTQNSGTLSYREIMDIIDQTGAKPYYDKTNAVKYVVWNQDQWVSYDDADTFKQKIDFANNLGLGGLLVWSIDQDTADLRALQGVLAPKTLTTFKAQADDASYWQSTTAPDCYVTDCGDSCNPGFTPITTQPCGSAKPVTRHSSKKDSTLCCPLSGAPDPKRCTWRGNFPSCNGHCHDGEVTVELNRWGDGDYCESGNKAYCCQVTALEDDTCYWTAKKCSGSDTLLTFAGTFASELEKVIDIFPPTLLGTALETVLDSFDITLLKRYCCPSREAKRWDNCQWHGTPGSCDDNHCALGHQVQLATNAYGLGQSCWPRLERKRVFCCDAKSGESPFLPVPLADLFPNPPSDPQTDYTLKTDDTWGTGVKQGLDDEPNDAAFAFVVLTSPEELQISLDKRDGSSWEVFNCRDAVSEEEHTVQMFCNDISESGNCDKIHLGHGVPGTIIEMPHGCGPFRYAVARSMVRAADQSLPKHLERRDYGHKPEIFDLTFDFDWKRVPRDLGNTLMRVDYSNEVGYWNSIVDKASDKGRKRSLEDYGGNHRRWLEEEWREDKHLGGLNELDLHARWFGSDVIDWLKGFFNPDISPKYTHNLNTGFTAILVDQTWDGCEINGAKITASISANARASVNVATSFGLTIIAKLGTPLDLSQSYLYFKNQGDVSVIFSIDALGRAVFSTGDVDLVGLQNFPGATFSIPKLLTLGPNFRLVGNVEAEVTLAGHVESQVQIAKWEVQQTYPAANSDYNPKALKNPDRDGTGTFAGLSKPTFDWSVKASGQITAHLKPTFEFGIIVDPIWHLGNAKVGVVADGWVRFHADAAASSQDAECPFTYGVDVGADLYATVDASAVGWGRKMFPMASIDPKSAISGGSCPAQEMPRSINIYNGFSLSILPALDESVLRRQLSSSQTYGPLLTLPQSCFYCPIPTLDDFDCDNIEGWEPSQLIDGGNIDMKRGLSEDLFLLRGPLTDTAPLNTTPSGMSENIHYNFFEKRTTKRQTMCVGASITIFSPQYSSSGTIIGQKPGIQTYGYLNSGSCTDFGFGLIKTPAVDQASGFATEHILEFQLIKIFIDAQSKQLGAIYANPYPDKTGKVSLCTYIQPYWFNLPPRMGTMLNGQLRTPIQMISYQFPGSDSSYNDEFVLLASGVNAAKEGMWGSSAINSDNTMNSYEQSSPMRAVKNVKDVLSAYKYHQIPEIKEKLIAQSSRVGNMFDSQEAYLASISVPNPRAKGTNMDVYKPIGLGDKWRAWIRGRAAQASSDAVVYMDQWVTSLQDGYTTPYQRVTAAAEDTDVAALIAAIDALALAVKARGNWANPF